MKKDNKTKLVPKLRFSEFKYESNWDKLFLNQIFSERRIKNNLVNAVLSATQKNGVVPSHMLERSIIRENKNLKNYKLVLPGDFVISLRSFEGGFEYSKYKGIISPAYTILYSKKEIIDVFFRYLFKRHAFITEIQRKLNLSLRDGKTISYKQASELEIAIPKPQEQKKIADCLSSLDELISAHSQKLESLKDYKKGLMQQLFPKEGEAVPKLRFPKFEKDGEWIKKSIESIAKVTAGGTPSSTTEEYWNGEIPWMNSGELNKKRIYNVSNYITPLGLKKSATKIIPKNCVLIGLAGQGKTRGTAAINNIELCTNQSIASIHPNNVIFNSEFLYHKIDSMYSLLRLWSKGEGGRGGLNLQIIKSIEISFPKKNEQKKIANCLSSLDVLITEQAKEIDELKKHKKGLMQRLFPEIEV